jgi:lipopolysaccharide biosynthesis regulator YciM
MLSVMMPIRRSHATGALFGASMLAGLLVCGLAHGAPLDQARALLKKGSYQAARSSLEKLGAKGRLDLAQLELETGNYRGAIKLARKAARGKAKAAALTLVAEAQRKLGQHKKAAKLLESVIKRHPKALRARVMLGVLYTEMGKQGKAKVLFDRFYDDYGADKINKNSASELTYVAIACRHTDNFRDAHDTLRDALKVDDKHVEAWLELGDISLEKYEAGHAEGHFKKVLAINPNHIRALIGLARVKLVQNHKLPPIRQLLAKVRKLEPYNPDANAIEAAALIDHDAYRKAEKLLEATLKRFPAHLETITVLAASRFLQDDMAKYRQLKKRALGINPRYTRFFRTVAKIGVRKHRYKEAIALCKEATKIDPEDWYALAEIGLNLLKLGREKEGLKHLERAWKGDQFNVRNFNVLNLYDDILKKSYAFAKSKHFRLRAHKSELPLLARTVLPLLEKGYTLYAKKYRYKPKGPITIELYKNPSHFSIRTFGFPPDPGAIGGVCFGTLVTALSPSLRRINWGQVLWHELNHVFTVGMTKHRVPRWLTEGLAVMEPMLYRPEWRRENDFDIYKAIIANRLSTLSNINHVFRKSLYEVLVGYYQGGLLADFFVRRYGMAKMRRVLLAYAKGQRTEKIFPRVYGKSLAQLDGEFRAAQLTRLTRYKRSFFVDRQAYRDYKKYLAAFKKNRKNTKAIAQLAASELTHRRLKDATRHADEALKLDAKNLLALAVRARIAAINPKERKQAEPLLQRLIAAGGDGYQARMALARLAMRRKADSTAIKHLTRAKQFDYERVRPYMMLAAHYEKKGQTDKQIAELKGVVQRNQQSFRYAAKLVLLLAKKKDWAEVRRYGEMANFIFPASGQLHKLMAQAYEAPAPNRDLKRAVWHLETALLCQVKDKKPLHKELARLYRSLGQHKKANSHAQQAK